ncbi:MAG: hypothetical protein PHE27_07935 [Alphaproteobacteria bacterium]|nr:hypothetical protein [Alphaproteobacteria bacterium]
MTNISPVTAVAQVPHSPTPAPAAKVAAPEKVETAAASVQAPVTTYNALATASASNIRGAGVNKVA